MRLAAATAGALLALGTLSCEDSGLYGQGRDAVAELRDPRSDVKVREAHKLVWSGGEDRTGLANYDAVRTGSASSGTVRYNDSSELRLGENTLVIVVDRTQKKDHERSVVAMPSGSVEGKVAADPERTIELEVRTSRGWIRASNRGESGRPKALDFRTSVTAKGEMSVTARSGEITFVARDEDNNLVEKKIGESESFSLPADPQHRTGGEEAGADNRALASVASGEPARLVQRVWNTGGAKAGRSSAEPGVDLFLIREPKDRARVSEGIVTVRGELSGRLRGYLMDTEIRPNAQGHFELQVRLERGANTLEFRITGPGPADVQTETLTVIRQ